MNYDQALLYVNTRRNIRPAIYNEQRLLERPIPERVYLQEVPMPNAPADPQEDPLDENPVMNEAYEDGDSLVDQDDHDQNHEMNQYQYESSESSQGSNWVGMYDRENEENSDDMDQDERHNIFDESTQNDVEQGDLELLSTTSTIQNNSQNEAHDNVVQTIQNDVEQDRLEILPPTLAVIEYDSELARIGREFTFRIEGQNSQESQVQFAPTVESTSNSVGANVSMTRQSDREKIGEDPIENHEEASTSDQTPKVKREKVPIRRVSLGNMRAIVGLLEEEEICVVIDENEQETMTFRDFPNPKQIEADVRMIKRENDIISGDMLFFESVCILIVISSRISSHYSFEYATNKN